MSKTQNIQNIELSQLYPYPGNIRADLGDTNELADSIKAQGIVQALVVRPHPTREGDFQVVMGHRRLAAAKQAELLAVPCQVRDDLDSEAKVIEVMMVENLQRTDLTKSEEGRGYQTLIDLGWSINQVAKRVGRKHETVDSRLKVAGLNDSARAKVDSGAATLDRALKIREFDDYPELAQGLEEHIDTDLFDYKYREAVEIKTWEECAPLALENATRIGFKSMTIEEASAGDWQKIVLPELRDTFPASPERVAQLETADFHDDVIENIDDYAFVLNHRARRVDWYQLADEPVPAALTAEQVAEQKAREEAVTSLRIARNQLVEHLKDIMTKPKLLKGSALPVLAHYLASSYTVDDIAGCLGVESDDKDLDSFQKSAYYSEKFSECTVDQLALAMLMLQLSFNMTLPAWRLFDLDRFSPVFLGYSDDERIRGLLSEHLGWTETPAERMARDFWEPHLPASQSGADRDEVNF